MKFFGKAKNKLSALELLGVFYSQGCEVQLEGKHGGVATAAPAPGLRAVRNMAELKANCVNEESPITLTEFDEDDIKGGIVTVKLPGSNKGECYTEENLRKYWTLYLQNKNAVVYLWKGSSVMTIDKTNPLFKLPISGAWITLDAARALESKKYVVLRKLNNKKHYVGSSIHWVGGVFGQIHDVYTV